MPDRDAVVQQWTGKKMKIYPDAETELSLNHVEIADVHLVAMNSPQLGILLRNLKSKWFELLDLENEQCSANRMIATIMEEFVVDAIKLQLRLKRWLRRLGEQIKSLEGSERPRCRDLILQAYNFSFEVKLFFLSIR